MISKSTRTSWKRALVFSAAIIGILLPGAAARADSTTFLVQVSPRGSVVEMNGPQTLVAASPNQLPRPQPGWYEIRASHPGYETWNSKLYLDATSPELLSLALKPKTRTKAAMRALAFPGWGHYYSDRKGRGILVTVAALGAAGAYLYLDNRYDSKLTDYEALQRDFDNAESIDEQRQLKPAVEEARRVAFDAESDRRNWGIAALAFYAYQVVDAVLFFPEVPELQLQGVQFGIRPGEQTPIMLGATYDF